MDEVSGDGSAELLAMAPSRSKFAYQNGNEGRPQGQTRAFFNSLRGPAARFGGDKPASAEASADWSMAPELASARSVDQALAICLNKLD
jgi:hypothetical protein